MTSLADIKPSPIKVILMSASGGGKTSSLIPLAIPNIIPGWPGKKLLVLNFDGANKFAELAKAQLHARLTRGKDVTPITQQQYDAAIANIDFVDCIDPRKVTRDSTGYNVTTIAADSWKIAKKALDNWSTTIFKEPENTIVVVDSFTHMSYGIAAYTMALANRLGRQPEFYKDYSPAQYEIRVALGAFTALPCGLVITAHQAPLDIKKKSETPERDPDTGEMVFREEVVDTLMLPASFGQGGRVDIPSTINHLLYFATNKNQQREIRLTPGRGILPKSPFFARAAKTYGLDKGLPEYFLLGES